MFQRALAAWRHPTDRFRNRRAIAGFYFFLFLVFVVPEGVLISGCGVHARKTNVEDRVRPLSRKLTPADMHARNIAVVEGTFTLTTTVIAHLYIIQSGAVDLVDSTRLGRPRGGLLEAFWRWQGIPLALAETEQPNHRRSEFWSQSTSHGFTEVTTTHDIEVVATATFPGRLWSGYEYILYIEGDRPFHAQRTMSINEFAATNEGNFLVVVVRMN